MIDPTTVSDGLPPYLAEDVRKISSELARSKERLRIALDSTGMVGTWDWDILNDKVYANERFAALYNVDPVAAAEGVAISSFLNAIHPDDVGGTEKAIDAALKDGVPFDHVYRIVQPDGATRHVMARGVVEFEDGLAIRFPGVTIDITERKQAEQRQIALLQVGDRLRDMNSAVDIAYCAMEIVGTLFEVSRAGYGTFDASQTYVDVHKDWRRDESVDSISRRHDMREYGSFYEDLKKGVSIHIADVTKDPRTKTKLASFDKIGVVSLLNVPLRENGKLVALLFLHDDKVHNWSLDKIDFLKNVADRIHAALERTKADADKQLLIHELKHRMKNTLAVVMSIAGQTLRSAQTLEQAQTILEQRIAALAASHDLLNLYNHTGAPLHSVIGDVSKLFGNEGQRIRMTGDDLRLSSKSAILFSLILHEMATNALKYGALSNDTGAVTISWEKKDDMFHLTWSEQDGPEVRMPSRRGFGSRMIERTLAVSFGGEAKLDFSPKGVTLNFKAPYEGLQNNAA